MYCIFCGNELYGKQIKFCSKNCKTKHHIKKSIERASKNRKKNLLKIIERFENKCYCCNKTFIPDVYNFHHLRDKKYGISTILNRKWTIIEKEISKCIMVCNNCHMELHYNIDIEQDNKINVYMNKRNHKRKQQYIDYLGGKCSMCGYNKCNASLCFHHINPYIKDFKISSVQRKFEDVKYELDKCILLCMNCHSIKHNI